MTPAQAREHWLGCEAKARTPLRELVANYVEAVLCHTGGNKVAAAKILGINRRTIARYVDLGRVQMPEDPQ